MTLDLHAPTAVLYLLASVAATLSLALRVPRLARAAAGVLGAGALIHTLAFLQLHSLDPTPQLTQLPAAVSLMAWMGTLFSLAFLWRARLVALSALVGPAAFLGVFLALVALPGASAEDLSDSPAWSHVHILLSSAGLGFLGVAGGAGLLFVIQHRRIKAKRRVEGAVPLPSLEALDRVNLVAISLGFLFLTLGLVSGMLWVYAVEGRLWPGTVHATATALAWAVYAGLVVARVSARQGPRQSALISVAGFAFLVLAVVGVGALT